MTTIKQKLKTLTKIKRKKSHHLIHHIHRRHNISHKTLFYIKEYGPHSNAMKTIIKESIKILLLASIISAFGGVAIEQVKLVFISIMPLIVLLPILNDMLGDYGTIISSRISTMLHEGIVKRNFLRNKELKKLFAQVIIIGLIIGTISSILALIVSNFSGFEITKDMIVKIISIVLIDIIVIVSLLFFISVFSGVYFFKKQEDPNNFLIPITTSIADFANMIVLAALVVLFF